LVCFEGFSSLGFLSGFSFPIGHWFATAYSSEGLFAATHHIWWAFPYPPPGGACGRSGHCTPIHGLSEDTRFRGRTGLANLTESNLIFFFIIEGKCFMHIPPPSPAGGCSDFYPDRKQTGLNPHPTGSNFGVMWDSKCRAMLHSVHHTH